MPRIISAPLNLVVATHQGVDIAFAGLSLSSDLPPWHEENDENSTSMEFRLRAVINEVTRKLDAEYADSVKAWKLQGTRQTGEGPALPSDDFFMSVEAEITDDLGTDYRWIGGIDADDESPWEAAWIYAPASPVKAEYLFLDFVVNGRETGQSCTIALKP